jgi:hypothetical protein
MIKIHSTKKVKTPQVYLGGTAFVNLAVGKRRVQFSLRPPQSLAGQVAISIIEGLAIGATLIAAAHSVGIM